ncbi:MAG TPA: DUF2520 domain-containing protein [Myxococcaceae bacterium]|nr:DUF2520 domain-containing protein [Myxococcaceae bacterium]
MASKRQPRPRKRPVRRARPPTQAERPLVVVTGFGRLGGALALGLRRAGWPVKVFPRSGESVRRAAALQFELADHDALRAAELCLIAVPENAVAKVARMLQADISESAALVHCSGALDLEAFGSDPLTLRRPRGSFHPLCAVSDARDDLAGHAVALSASSRPLLRALEQMATDLGLTPIYVPEAKRAAYHAGAVMSAGGLVALASAAAAAFAEAGIEEKAALSALLPLMRSALRGIERRGLARALTGPLIRGDISVIRANLNALPPDLAELYRALAWRALSLAAPQLPEETRSALEATLADQSKMIRGP